MARIISAVVFLPILIVTLWRGSPIYFAALVGIALALGLIEYYRLAERVGARGGRVQGILAAAALLTTFYYGRHEWIVAALAVLVIVELAVQLFTNSDLRATVAAAAVTVFGVAYVAVLGGYLIAIRVVEDDATQLPAKLLSLFFLIVFAGDTGAYYTGRALGRHKLAPRLSPGKTIEGLIGGLIANVAAALIAHYTFFPELKIAHAVPLALVMGGLGVIGDLCESMLKRGAQTKDAAQIIPGHGGLLDRLDSILFNAPLLYYYYVVFMK
jgi:phosphatidate cytidylyltransferase